MKGKIGDLESQIGELKINCNSKIDGEEAKQIIDRKFQVLNEYRRDAESLSQKCNEITS